MISAPIILVTGAGGQLGMELQDLAPSFPQYKFIFKKKEDLPLDQRQAIERSFEETTPSYCINAAAYTQVDKAELPEERNTVFAINAHGVHDLAQVCSHHGTKLLHLSTDYVFNGQKKEAYTEEDSTGPINIYGESKLQGEQFALSGPNALVIRTSWVYSSYGKNFVKTMLRLMKEKGEISVVNDQFGSPTYAADLAEAIIRIISFPEWKPGLYHYSNAGVISWYDFAIAVRELSNNNCSITPIPTSAYKTLAIRPAWSVLDNGKIRQTFGIRQKDWKESLQRCLSKLKK